MSTGTGPVGAHRAELALIAACAGARADRERLAAVRRRTDEVRDWGWAVAAAEAHGVGRLFAARLRAAGVAVALPPALQAHQERVDSDTVALNLSLAAQMAGLIEALAGHGIPALGWKGPVLAVVGYGHVGLRTFIDLDLVVAPAHLRRARDLLLVAGYRLRAEDRRLMDGLVPPAGDAYRLEPADPALGTVELHRRVWIWPFALRLGTRDLLARAVPADVCGRPIPTLSAEDLLLSLAAHGTQHDWSRLRYASEIDAAARLSIDWPAALARAREARMARMLRVALALAAKLFGTPLPEPARAEVAGDSRAGALADEAAARMLDPGTRRDVRRVRPWSTVHWRSREGVADHVRYGVRALAADWALKVSLRSAIEARTERPT